MTIKLFFGKTLFLATMLFTSIYTFAFTVNGINYTATSATEVKVDSTPTASGIITIPSTVKDSGGTTYNVTSIGDYAFMSSSLTSINLPISITSIGDNAFARCSSLTSIDLPSSITSIGDNAFAECFNLTSINFTLPRSITSIGDYAFAYCTSLASITLPSSITSIGGSAFKSCTSLTSINLPISITSIGDNAFARCSSLASVTVNWSPTPLDMSSSLDAFYNIASAATLYVPNTTRSAYLSADVWKNFSLIVESTLAITDFNKDKDKVFFDGATNSLKLLTTSPKPFGEYEIYDATGRTILKGNANSGEISLNNISKGIYFLRAKNLASTVKFRK